MLLSRFPYLPVISAVLLFVILLGLQIVEELNKQVYYNKGYNEALDTIQKIIDKQSRDSITISKVTIETKKDTLTYILSNK